MTSPEMAVAVGQWAELEEAEVDDDDAELDGGWPTEASSMVDIDGGVGSFEVQSGDIVVWA